MIKTKLVTAIACALMFVPTFTGCKTPEQNQLAIEAAAMVLQTAADAGARYAIQQDANNARWFALATVSISTFLTGKDYTPGAFQAKLLADVPQLTNNFWVSLTVGAVIDTYQLYYRQYVINQISSNNIAPKFLLAIQNGFDMALQSTGNSRTVGMPDKMKVLKQKAEADKVCVLPRPIFKK